MLDLYCISKTGAYITGRPRQKRQSRITTHHSKTLPPQGLQLLLSRKIFNGCSAQTR
jgi:hypothetical protein